MPGNLKFGLLLLLVSFAVSVGLLLPAAVLVKPDEPPSAVDGNGGEPGNGNRPPPGGPPPTRVEVTGRNIQFDRRTLTVAAQAEVTIVFHNQDPGVLHNVAAYRSRAASQAIFVGELFAGVATREYTFTSPAPGSYFYRCDVHPDTMTGTLVVR